MLDLEKINLVKEKLEEVILDFKTIKDKRSLKYNKEQYFTINLKKYPDKVEILLKGIERKVNESLTELISIYNYYKKHSKKEDLIKDSGNMHSLYIVITKINHFRHPLKEINKKFQVRILNPHALYEDLHKIEFDLNNTVEILKKIK